MRELWTDLMIEVDRPELVLIVGCVGFGLNLLSAAFVHGRSLLVTASTITRRINM